MSLLNLASTTPLGFNITHPKSLRSISCLQKDPSEGVTKLAENVSVPAVIAFGDSYVDSGNNNQLNTVAKSNFRPYGKDFMGGKPTGRFTNGKTLADTIAEAFDVKEYLPAYLDPLIQDKDLLTGVSFGSGGTGYDPLTPKIASVIPLSGQLDMFKEYISKLKVNVGEEATEHMLANSLFLVVASTNDLGFNYSDVPIRRLQYDVHQYSSLLVMLATNFIQEIYKLGARKIGVFSAPPVGCLPAQRTLAGGINRICVEKYNKAAQVYNIMLKQQLQFLDNTLPQSRIAYIDYYDSVLNIIQNPLQYGFEVVDKGCCGTGLIEVSFLCNVLTPTCPDDSKLLFWDSFHPTEAGYKMIVNQVLPELVSLVSDETSS